MGSMRAWVVRAAAGLGVLLLLWWAFRPQPVAVDLAPVTRGPLTVSVADDGETRVRDVYVVSAPLPGRVLRFEGDVGDTVTARETVVASILPSRPTLLDARRRSELEAALEAAEAAFALAGAEVARIEAELEFARAELERAAALARRGIVSAAELDRARRDARTREAALGTARAALRVREHERATARASLMDPDETDGARGAVGDDGCCFDVRAPVSGKILRILQESEAVVGAGAPLVEIGEPADLEVVVDLLSTEAVRVSVGDRVQIEHWGGDGILNGRVRRVEPYGFTKVSALGIEEQRVNVIVDITDPRARWERLGHGYRVEARVVLWHEDDVLRVPLAAMFRHGEAWAVFTVAGGRARLRPIEVGHMNDRYAELLGGLDADTTVVLHPSDRVRDGITIVTREGSEP